MGPPIAAAMRHWRRDCRALRGRLYRWLRASARSGAIPCRSQGEARSFWTESHPDKTRLIEFGRHAIANRCARGLGKPETFDFLGFKHYCATRRDGDGFVLGRKPMAKRMRTKLREIKGQLMATRHDGIDGQ